MIIINYIFLIKFKKIVIINFIIKNRNQFNKLDKVSIHLPEIQTHRFNPSLLFLLLYKDKVKNIILGNKFSPSKKSSRNRRVIK